MGRDTIRLDGGVIARIEVIREENYDVSGSFKNYAFRATIFDSIVTYGIMGSRIVSLEMWRANKSILGYTKILPILRCRQGRWSLRPDTKNDYKSSCSLVYILNKMLPITPQKRYK